MTATCDVVECNGASPGTWTVVTSVRFCTADTYNPGLSYPIPIVSGQTKRSYWKSICLSFGGTYTQITNVCIYTDGSDFGTGITTYIGDETLPANSYQQATGVQGDTGDEMVATHSGITSKTAFFTYTSTNKKLVDAGPITGTAKSKHVVLQMDVSDTATPGVKGPETITWTYDEI